MPTALSPQDERAFQKWYMDYATVNQLNLNPDDPKHFYDYRAWWKSGIPAMPDPKDIDHRTGKARMHGPDSFKLPGHPNTLWAGNDILSGVQIRPTNEWPLRLSVGTDQQFSGR